MLQFVEHYTTLCRDKLTNTYIYIIDIYLDVVIVVTQEFRSSFRFLQTTELLVGTVFQLLLLTCGRCVLLFDVVEKKLFSVHTVSENFSPFKLTMAWI